VPVLDDYFQPSIPAVAKQFAKCAFNVQRIGDLERLVRACIRHIDFAKKESDARNTTGL
jgi:hypothetical protein